MNKAVVIIITTVWLICAMYLALATAYNYPYAEYARLGTWATSLLLLLCIIIYIKKHRDKKKNKQ